MSNATKGILSGQGKKTVIKVRTGLGNINEFQTSPGIPVICKIPVKDKPQPCLITLSGWVGELTMFAST
jgi:hypothetical protein